jgi:hypothetical protein
MLELFQTPRANSIQRDGKAQKGFRNVAFIDFGTPGTPIPNPRAYGAGKDIATDEVIENQQELIEFNASVPGVPTETIPFEEGEI